MRAARLYGKEDIRVEEVEEPEVRPGTVKIRPAFNGICGTDLYAFHYGPMPPAPSSDQPHPLSGETLPIVLGHEFSGVVEALGEGVTRLSVGDRVAVEPLMVDGTCTSCNSGKYNLCDQLGFIGFSGGGGGLSEHIVVEERWVHRVGDMPLDQAAMIEPLAVALHAVKHAGVAPGQTAVVGGAGPIGLLIASVLKAKGVTTIVSEISANRRAKALSSGVADFVVDPVMQDLVALVRERTGGAGAELAFDAAGAGAVVQQLLSVLSAGGRLEVVAIHAKPIELDITTQLTTRDLVIGSAIGYAGDHAEAIELVQSGKVDLAPFITSKIVVDDIVTHGFERLINDKDNEVKILVSMQ